MADQRQLHLNINITGVGRHPAAWRVLPDPGAWVDVELFRTIARIAERGTLDAVFLSDRVAVQEGLETQPAQALEPTVLLTALAGATERVGLIGTASTTYSDPYNLARRFASVDHVSGGRVAWNVVTTWDPGAAGNFGLDGVPESDDRYRRADEFVDVVRKLWDSWEDDAVVGDRDTGRFVDPDKVHPIEHVGREFRVRGALNLPRSPQGRPVLVQAGSSDAGQALAARVADAVFTVQTTFDAAQTFYADVKDQARRLGRNPDHVLIFPGLYPVVGGTEAEAWRRKEELDALVDQHGELVKLARQLGVDPEALRLDRELPYELIARVPFKGSSGFRSATVNLGRSQQLTVRQLLSRNPGAHRIAVGAPEQIADDIERWFTGRAADGFNLNTDVFPSGLEAIVEHLLPELRKRGVFRTEYRGTTLRDHLGLPRPASQYARATRVS
ncbi:MAG: LLM class flavin-dependent oxidoreductase [Ilumatobacteraceae bacterium]